jgi:hypothetical protein
MTAPALPAAEPGDVKVRLLGGLPECKVLTAFLACSAAVDAVSVSLPYRDRRERGGRLCLTVRARTAQTGRPEVRFGPGEADTYFVLTEALPGFASRQRAAREPRLAEMAGVPLNQVDAAVLVSDEKAGPGGSHPPGPLAPIS